LWHVTAGTGGKRLLAWHLPCYKGWTHAALTRCIYIYIYIYIYIHTHTHTHTHIYIYIYIIILKKNSFHLYLLAIQLYQFCDMRKEIINNPAYCNLWPVWLYHIFPHYVIHSMILKKKKLLNMKCLLWFSLLLNLRIIQLDIIINGQRSSCKVPIILVRLSWNLDFLDRFLKNSWKTIYCKTSYSMWTDWWHDEANSHLSKVFKHD